MLFKLSNLNSNLALTLGYLNLALYNSAQVNSHYLASQIAYPHLLVVLKQCCSEMAYFKRWCSECHQWPH